MFDLECLKRWDRQVDHGNDDLVEGAIAEIERLQYRVLLLQNVIDIRPAKNAGLHKAYEKWTNSIYTREANEALAQEEPK